MSWLAAHADTENCYLGTVGRVSGRTHEVEIWFGVVGDVLYMINGSGAADWYRNALVNPEVTVRIDGETRAGRAFPLDDAGGEARRARSARRGATAPNRRSKYSLSRIIDTSPWADEGCRQTGFAPGIYALPRPAAGRCLAPYGKEGASHLGWTFLGGSRRADAAFQRIGLL